MQGKIEIFLFTNWTDLLCLLPRDRKLEIICRKGQQKMKVEESRRQEAPAKEKDFTRVYY